MRATEEGGEDGTGGWRCDAEYCAGVEAAVEAVDCENTVGVLLVFCVFGAGKDGRHSQSLGHYVGHCSSAIPRYW